MIDKLRRAASDRSLSIGEAWHLLDAAADEIERLQVDANRYRWIRDGGYRIIEEDRGIGPTWPDADQVDALVDAAMREALFVAEYRKERVAQEGEK